MTCALSLIPCDVILVIPLGELLIFHSWAFLPRHAAIRPSYSFGLRQPPLCYSCPGRFFLVGSSFMAASSPLVAASSTMAVSPGDLLVPPPGETPGATTGTTPTGTTPLPSVQPLPVPVAPFKKYRASSYERAGKIYYLTQIEFVNPAAGSSISVPMGTPFGPALGGYWVETWTAAEDLPAHLSSLEAHPPTPSPASATDPTRPPGPEV